MYLSSARETQTADNVLLSRFVVTILGDIKVDFIIDIYDAITLRNGYNSVPLSSNRNCNSERALFSAVSSIGLGHLFQKKKKEVEMVHMLLLWASSCFAEMVCKQYSVVDVYRAVVVYVCKDIPVWVAR